MTTTIAFLLLLAAMLPWVAAVLAKLGGEGFDNREPRAWLAKQTGRRARANAAQANLFEGLPFFYAAVLFSLYNQADSSVVVSLMLAWIAARAVYIAVYMANLGGLRSLVWGAALILNIALLFA